MPQLLSCIKNEKLRKKTDIHVNFLHLSQLVEISEYDREQKPAKVVRIFT